MRSDRGARAARGVLVALLATFVALMSHVAAGGQPPGWLGILVPMALAMAVSTVLAGRRMSLWRLAASVAASQVLFHTLFSLGAPDASRLLSGHEHHHPVSTTAEAFASGSDHVHGTAGMWGAHLVAAIITIAVIYIGERSTAVAAAVVAGAQAWMARAETLTSTPQHVSVETPARVVPQEAAMLRSLCVLMPQRRRGPPLLSAI